MTPTSNLAALIAKVKADAPLTPTEKQFILELLQHEQQVNEYLRETFGEQG